MNTKIKASLTNIEVASSDADARGNALCASKKAWMQPCLDILSTDVTAGKSLTNQAEIGITFGPS